ncbi:protein argonaute 4A-like [Lotus japonicus]|uniref:protein argonaute 4A-like n=1 Tax=Lotus japonicus TaxID=34305 RepID=UPI00258965CA|nr:protein argonaute 4A-like [Lotus japonicus]
MARRGFGTKGQKIRLLGNHFSVVVNKKDGYFYHYSVAMSFEDGHPLEVKGLGRKVIDKLCETYDVLPRNKSFAYDGEKSLFTVGPLEHTKQEFVVVLEEVLSKSPGSSNDGGDNKRMRLQSRSKTIKVELNYAAKVPLRAITDAVRGQDSERSQEALRVLDIVLRQCAAKQECLLVRQSFFRDIPRNFTDLAGGIQSCRGFHTSFRATHGGLSINVDVSTTVLVKPGPVLDFLCQNQNVQHPNSIDWIKAKRMLKNLRVKANNVEYKITGLSEKPCRSQTFLLRRGKNANGEEQSSEMTIYEYFKAHKNIELHYSADMPCINVGKPKRPCYFPVELCTMVSLQRYTKALTNLQRAQLVEKSRQKPQERKAALQDSLRASRYGNEPMLHSCGITIEPNLIEVEARVLQAPRLIVGDGVDILPRNGRWNFNDKKLVEPEMLKNWAIVNFSARCDMERLLNIIRICSERKGMRLNRPLGIIEEDNHCRRESAAVRVDNMYENLKSKLSERPQLLLCLLPERKNSELYGPWKKRSLAKEGIATQCIAPTKLNDQYITNVLLKINAKLGGMNSFLSIEDADSIPLVSDIPTLILGMDVSHGSPGRSDVPSIAAVVSSRCWPKISRYRAAVRTQSPRAEMISSLYKPVSDTQDDGIIRELLLDFYATSQHRKPEHIIIFRDGVGESQFNQVLNFELDEIIKACKHLDGNDERWNPKFTVIVAQKRHHTRFFHANNAQENVPAGTVIDNSVCHPRNNDFYMFAHSGMIGTSRPTYYHVLHDEIGFSADALQELVLSLSYVYQRSTTGISVVAPICYAHLAAAQMAQFVKLDDLSETSSSTSSTTIPQIPRLHKRVANSMFFC